MEIIHFLDVLAFLCRCSRYFDTSSLFLICIKIPSFCSLYGSPLQKEKVLKVSIVVIFETRESSSLVSLRRRLRRSSRQLAALQNRSYKYRIHEPRIYKVPISEEIPNTDNFIIQYNSLFANIIFLKQLCILFAKHGISKIIF